MSTQPGGRIAADRPASDAAPLVPTATAATQPADHAPADRVTAREIAEFLRHHARIRSSPDLDPADRAAFLARKADLFARIAAQHARSTAGLPASTTPPPPTTPMAPEGRTP